MFTTKNLDKIGGLTLALALLSSPAPLWAQDGDSVLEEIIVTARKREESLMKTPISITAFSGETLSKVNIMSLDQVGDQTPGMVFVSSANISGSSNASSVFIRGVGQSDYRLAVEPGVGIYVDDVYLPHSIGNVANVVDVERIEVLRGPQGTLFGRKEIMISQSARTICNVIVVQETYPRILHVWKKRSMNT